MKTIRKTLVFPLELALVAATLVFVLADFICQILGQACQLAEGPQ